VRKPLILCALAAAVLVPPAAADDSRKAEGLDKKVLDLVKQATDLYRNARAAHVEAEVMTRVENGEQTRQIKSEAVYDLQKPNLFSLRTRLDGDANAGPDVVSDGKKLFIHAKRLKQYTEADAPQELSAFGRVIPQFGHPTTGMLFQNLLTDDPYETLMDGVTRCSYAGKENVGGAPAHHLKFEQPNLEWDLWIAAEGKPLVLKASSVQASDGGKVSTVETYKSWKTDAALRKDAFSFSTPEGSKKVKLFNREDQDKQ
jgi:hypothetical protein